MNNFYAMYPAISAGGVPIYANVGSFPVTAPTGSLAVDASSGNLYEFNGNSWVLIAGPAFSSKQSTYVHTLTSTDISNQYITLPSMPLQPSNTLVTVIGGPMQEYSVDYSVSGSEVTWAGYFLSGVVMTGDVMIVEYN